ncbi:radical SAM protein, partial [bacterium]|nr:radical SAM protein [bacterium]
MRHALGLPLAPVVVVTGCLAALDSSALHDLGDRVVVEPDKQRVADRVREALGTRGPAVGASATAPARARAQLKVEDGCDAFCSYCIVPYARGVPRPVPLEQVMAQAQKLADTGVSEVVLTGINIGRYNDAGARLPDLFAAVAQAGVPRIRLSSIEPVDVTDRLVEVASA